MSDPDQIAALKRELAGYERCGRSDRAAQVREQLEALGETVEHPASARAENAKAAPAKRRTRKVD